MRSTCATCVLGLFVLLSIAGISAHAAAGGDAVSVAAAKMTIDGTSTMHDYSLSTTALAVTADFAEGRPLLEPGALQTLELQIPVDSFTSEKDGLKKKMLETMKAKQHPLITYKLAEYTIDGGTVRAKGTLTVAGVDRDIDLELNVVETAEGLQVRGTRTLSMKEFGIKAPTMFMGMLKTNDQVTIKFELQLGRAATAGH